ncbi:hypothetical protein [Legionella jordanis]|uniref:Uncharacterized protein n=1 Tax=Legionella jordanis TaxID=456 RepID=A0A0W0VAD7_9GAMM|nr:hypothetical protein [Legionella jordanis]KTD17039.1 hypothetical protein Ljor_1345 [Legionella jordanis]VEH12765.1 Uncharacterised protein [Legionella jordanis]
MKKEGKKDHPEVRTTKNICDITPGHKNTRDVCDVVNKQTGKTLQNNDKPKK